MELRDIIELYKQCGIEDETKENEVIYVINTGSINNKLNTNFAGLNKKEDTVFVNSAIAKTQAIN